jgi:hypothetical protein
MVKKQLRIKLLDKYVSFSKGKCLAKVETDFI